MAQRYTICRSGGDGLADTFRVQSNSLDENGDMTGVLAILFCAYTANVTWTVEFPKQSDRFTAGNMMDAVITFSANGQSISIPVADTDNSDNSSDSFDLGPDEKPDAWTFGFLEFMTTPFGV